MSSSSENGEIKKEKENGGQIKVFHCLVEENTRSKENGVGGDFPLELPNIILPIWEENL